MMFRRISGFFCSLHLLLLTGPASAQSELESPKNPFPKYLEDQFYFGVGINFLTDRPSDVVQHSLSYSLQAGFIKDIPINVARNLGFGMGLGYTANSYYSNIGADKTNGELAYTLLDSEVFKRNKLETHALEIPIELRWRTSTPTEYKFWRIYTGIKMGYVFSGTSKRVTDMATTRFSNGDIRNVQYGLILNFGYNTWNIHAYYSLNPLLEDGIVLGNGGPMELRILRIGIIFYIL